MKHAYLLAFTLGLLFFGFATDLAPALQLGFASPFFPKQDSTNRSKALPIGTCTCQQGDLVFSLDSCRYHFGLIDGNPEQIQLTFYAKNIGGAPVIITNANTSCGCDVPSWPKEPILPGKLAKFTYTYDSKRIGPFTKTMCIFYNQTSRVLIMDGRVPTKEESGAGIRFEGTRYFEQAIGAKNHVNN